MHSCVIMSSFSSHNVSTCSSIHINMSWIICIPIAYSIYMYYVIRLRPLFILIIFRPNIFEWQFQNHCAKKFDGALRKPTSFYVRIRLTQTPNIEILSLKIGRKPCGRLWRLYRVACFSEFALRSISEISSCLLGRDSEYVIIVNMWLSNM